MRLRCQDKILGIQCPKDTFYQPDLPYAHLGVGKVFFLLWADNFLLESKLFLEKYISFKLKFTPVVHLKIFEAFCVQSWKNFKVPLSTKIFLYVPFQTLKVPLMG